MPVVTAAAVLLLGAALLTVLSAVFLLLAGGLFLLLVLLLRTGVLGFRGLDFRLLSAGSVPKACPPALADNDAAFRRRVLALFFSFF